MGTAVTELGILKARGVTGSWVTKAKWWHPTAQGKVGVVTRMDSSQSSEQNSLTHPNLKCWRVDHGISTSETDGEPPDFLLGLDKQKVLGQVNKSLT